MPRLDSRQARCARARALSCGRWIGFF